MPASGKDHPFQSRQQRMPPWNNHIDNMAALQEYAASGAVFVAIDVEGQVHITDYSRGKVYDGLGATEVGISVLSPAAVQAREPGVVPPFDLHEFAAEYKVETHSIRVNGKHRVVSDSWTFRREPLQFGSAKWVDEDEAEAAVVDTLISIRDRHICRETGAAPTMVLVGFAMGAEIFLFTRGLARIFEAVKFSGFADLQELVIDMGCPREAVRRLPGMCGTLAAAHITMKLKSFVELVAEGKSVDTKPIRSRSKDYASKSHAAGNDVVRELCLLVHLLHDASLPADTPIVPFADAREKFLKDFPLDPTQYFTLYFSSNSSTGSSTESSTDRSTVETCTTASSSSTPPTSTTPLGARFREMFVALHFTRRRHVYFKTYIPGRSRPQPFEDHPFTVMVRPTPKRIRLRDTFKNERSMLRLFEAYNPIAAPVSDINIGWVSLPTAELRDKLVADFKGKTLHGIKWHVVPLGMPIEKTIGSNSYRRYVCDRRRPGNEHIQETRHREKQARRDEMEDMDVSLAFGMEMFNMEEQREQPGIEADRRRHESDVDDEEREDDDSDEDEDEDEDEEDEYGEDDGDEW